MKQFCRLVKAHTFLTCLVLAAALLVSIVIGIGTGPVAIPFAEVWRVMFHRLGGLLTGSELPLEGVRESTQNIVWFLRAPRVLLGALVGAALTLSGVGMQAFTKNPLAEPYVLGISSGASLGAVLAMLLGVSLPVLGRLSVSAGAFAGALSLSIAKYMTPDKGTSHSNEVILAAAGDASAAKTAVLNARQIGLELLIAMGSYPETPGVPYL